MAEKKRSAEKDLLKLIEDPEEAAAQAKAGARAPKKAFALPFFSGQKPFRPKDLLKHGNINKLLIVAAIVIFVYLVLTFLIESVLLKKADRFTDQAVERIKQGAPADEAMPGDLLEAETAEEEKPPARSIFKLGPVEVPKEEQETATAQSALQGYKLVGISIEPDPQNSYAMIENATTNVTYFLKKGDKLTEMQVLEITAEKVVFDVGGKPAELR